jgi:hypothetical protein
MFSGKKKKKMEEERGVIDFEYNIHASLFLTRNTHLETARMIISHSNIQQ